MREGWHGFISRRWLWTIVLEFALFVAVSSGANGVLGPVVAHTRLGGARNWGLILTASAVGAVLGGLVMLRYRPRRMLLVASLSVPAEAVFLFALAVPVSVPLLAACSLLAGGCLTVFGVNWSTTMQQEIPPEMLSRISSYDVLGSLALAPVGAAVAGPLASVFGIPAVLTAGGILVVLLTVAVLFVPEVRQLQRRVGVNSDAGQHGAGKPEKKEVSR
jgi:MFS family permease